MTAKFDALLPLLLQAGVRFIVVGGGAGIAHGASRATYDVDIVYSRDFDNIQRLATVLQAHHPYLRGAPPGLPFTFDVNTVKSGLNFTLSTGLGDLDLLGEVAGGGTYEELLPFTEELEVFSVRCRFVTLEKLIDLKRAAGRPKDLEAIAELEAILEERQRPG
ncbi:MAG TPA: hypothetical protein V6D22_11105 [Candidatus Obscuribacterales bacterium]